MRRLNQQILGRHRKSLLLTLVPAVAATVFLAAPIALAQASQPAQVARTHLGASHPSTQNATGIFENYTNGMCLGISGGRDDAPAVLWSCNGHKDQSWTIPNTGTAGHIVNGDGQCLGVAGGNPNEGATIVGWSCLNDANQYWYIDTSATACYHNGVAFTYFPIRNRQTGLVIGVAGGSARQGAALITWPFQNACNNQYWAFA